MAGGKYMVAGIFLAVLAVSYAAKEPTAPKANPGKPAEEKTPLVESRGGKSAAAKLDDGPKKILVLLPIGSPSHNMIVTSVIDGLLERGHYLTVVGSKPRKKHPRLREVLFPDPYEEFRKQTNLGWLTKPGNAYKRISMLYFLGSVLTEAVLKNPDALALKKENFDLVVVESYFYQEALLGFAHHFGCPALNIHTFGYTPMMNEFTGGNINPAYVPNVYAGYGRPDTFLERLDNTVTTVFTMLANHLYWYPKMNAMMHEVFPDAPHVYDLLTNASLTLINNHPAVMETVALAPSVIEMGGVHIKPGKPLPPDLRKWIEESKDGIVYFSLGSNIKPELLPVEKKNAIFGSFAKLKQRVLIKWNGPLPPNPPANCRFEEWVPQQEVLAHPKLKVFVTHGGLLSTQESVYFGAAVVGMPVFGDQMMNMKLAVQKGFGQMVSFHEFTQDDMFAVLTEVIYNPKYREQSQKMSIRFRSDPIPPLERAIYYIELLMKLGDLKHLQPSSVHLPWYQYLLLDVIAVVALGLYVSWRIIRLICSTCFGFCCRSSKTKKD